MTTDALAAARADRIAAERRLATAITAREISERDPSNLSVSLDDALASMAAARDAVVAARDEHAAAAALVEQLQSKRDRIDRICDRFLAVESEAT